MALPIKPSDTQEGCNPISSNCVIWQGPDIPCIKLCTGDSVSDVVAKLAEELCTIADQLDISLIDITCFGAISPTPTDFKQLIELLITKICQIETALDTNGSGSSVTSCPDNCLVAVATCLQPTDALGNLITELPLKDYLTLIGTRVCTIISQINGINGSIVNIESRLTLIEQTVSGLGGSASIDITSANCVGNNTTQPIQSFVLALEAELCKLITSVGTGAEINAALASQCTIGGRPLANAPQLSDPTSTMGSLPNWVQSNDYNTLADSVNNLWLTVCDMRTALSELQTSLSLCCSPTCDSVVWNMTASGIRAIKFIDLFFTGSIPQGFNYCTGSTAPITIKDSKGNTGIYNLDVIANINSGAPLGIDIVGTSAITEHALWYQVQVPVCVSDNTGLSCNTTRTFDFYNSAWCENRLFTLTSTNTVPSTSGTFTLDFTAASTPTTYVLTLKRVYSTGLTQTVDTQVMSSVPGGPQSYTFPGTYTSGDTYFVIVTSRQNSAEFGNKEIDCTTATIPVAS